MEEEKKGFGIYIGLRDDSFKELIFNILGNVSEDKYKKTLLSDLSMSYFSTAFTHPSADTQNNYNFLKALGHVSFQKNIVWYLSRKKIILDKTKLEKIITEYKIRLIKSLGKMIIYNNIFDYITIDKKYKTSLIDSGNDEKIIQAILESFFGAVELVLDTKYSIGTGNKVVYESITEIFDRYIELEETIEKDPKTILNEIFINNKKNFGSPEYEELENKEGIYYINLYQVLPNKQRFLIGQGVDKPKKQAEKNAAKQALEKNLFYSYTYDPTIGKNTIKQWSLPVK
jgi:dsRNA-specific ribonuclease